MSNHFWFALIFNKSNFSTRPVDILDVGFGNKDWREMYHYEIQYVVFETNYLSNTDAHEDYALIHLVENLPISHDQIPTINFLKIPHRSHMQVIGFQSHRAGVFKREAAKLKMRIYECESGREPTTETDKLICYQLRHFGVASPDICGAMIVSDNGPPYELYGMHVKYYNLKSWFMEVGRAINVAGDFHYWVQAAKFERFPQHIPSNKKLFCCNDATLNQFKENKALYYNRKYAKVTSDGDPPLC